MMDMKIPVEYHNVVDPLFPEHAWTVEKPPSGKVIDAFAESLGIVFNYTRLKLSIAQEARNALPQGSGSDAYNGGLRLFLERFQENFDLMIAKTWVEKDDEERKDKLQWQIPGFTALIEKGDYTAALIEFSSLIHELAYLLFGEQSKKDDFLDYTFRIDPPMGLFFWYGLHLSVFFEQSGETARDILLLGMCYLTDF
jgi:hypothetical protein